MFYLFAAYRHRVIHIKMAMVQSFDIIYKKVSNMLLGLGLQLNKLIIVWVMGWGEFIIHAIKAIIM